MWVWDGPFSAGTRLLELVDIRIGRLDDDERDLLECVAMGEPLPLAALWSLAPRAVIERAERRGLVTTDQTEGVVVRCGHPLYGEVVRARLPPMLTATVCQRVAAALDAGEVGSDVRLRLTLLRLDAGEGLDAATFSLERTMPPGWALPNSRHGWRAPR